MKHCHISILCNELPFLKQKLHFMYDNFDQIIFVDYNLKEKSNSTDGSIEFIEDFPDPLGKITLVKNFDPNTVTVYKGVSFIEKRKMFAKASEFVKDGMDVIWATDMDEFFHKELISKVENVFDDKSIISIDIPHRVFVYNSSNFFDKSDFYIAPRITRHQKGFVYGHCDFGTYGKTVRLPRECYYHYAFIGYNRCKFKFDIYNDKSRVVWLTQFIESIIKKDTIIQVYNPQIDCWTSAYKGDHPDYIDTHRMCLELNNNLDFITDIKHWPVGFRYWKTRNVTVLSNHIYTTIKTDVDYNIIGYGHLDRDDGKVWLGICVMEQYQGKGYGKRIMEELLRNRNKNDLYLTVDKDNLVAQKLYESFGFKKIKEDNVLYLKNEFKPSSVVG